MHHSFGFSAALNTGNNPYLDFQLSDTKKNIKTDSFICYNHMVRKFEYDKLFVETKDYLLVLDGVIANKQQLDKAETWFDSLIQLYCKKGETFFSELRGSFGGLLYDKKVDKYIVFSDHIGSKFLYYTMEGDTLICSTMIRNIYDFLKRNHLSYNLSIESAFLLLTYGYMLDNRTLCDRIFRIPPGCYLVLQNGKLSEKRYCLLDNTPDETMSEKDAIELFDSEFRKAVALEFDKDNEYGYRHLVALSGGLDSRMVSWVAHNMGYTEQLNFTFSQSDYWDEIVPKQIARDLKHEWIFKMLDNGLWLYDIDEITELTGGNVLYYGLAHGNSLFKHLNFDDKGVIHTGQLGDVVFGTFYSSNREQATFKLGDGAYSTTYLDRLKDLRFVDFPNQEISNFYYRGFSGANNGLLASMCYSEVLSPFMNWDLMNSILKVPVKYRFDHHLYKKWIIERYPLAADYVWEKMKATIKSPVFKIRNRDIALKDLIRRIKVRLIGGDVLKTAKHMNPLSFYLIQNQDLYNFIYDKFSDNMRIADNELRQVITQIKEQGNGVEIIQATSLISAINRFFS